MYWYDPNLSTLVCAEVIMQIVISNHLTPDEGLCSCNYEIRLFRVNVSGVGFVIYVKLRGPMTLAKRVKTF